MTCSLCSKEFVAIPAIDILKCADKQIDFFYVANHVNQKENRTKQKKPGRKVKGKKSAREREIEFKFLVKYCVKYTCASFNKWINSMQYCTKMGSIPYNLVINFNCNTVIHITNGINTLIVIKSNVKIFFARLVSVFKFQLARILLHSNI